MSTENKKSTSATITPQGNLKDDISRQALVSAIAECEKIFEGHQMSISTLRILNILFSDAANRLKKKK